MATIRETRIAIKKRKAAEEKAEAERAAAAAAKAAAEAPEEEDERSFIDRLRDLLDPDPRAGSDAIAALESGIAEGDAANKDKK